MPMPGDGELHVDDDGRIRLAGRLDLSTVAGLADRGTELFVQRQEAIVDLADVSRTDSAALALLLEWQRAAGRSGCRLRFENVPETLRSIADVCGIEAVIELPAS
ncbi:MAG: STAS domain-containing protein [Gammaproteobacteria bacterium]|nr:STAS domain-containing protein [Gammaproteobacteria bacterium]